MKSLIEKLEEYAKNDPDKAILFDDFSKNGITYGQLDIMSGKIYSYLKSEGIGKEDIVMICLPRSYVCDRDGRRLESGRGIYCS